MDYNKLVEERRNELYAQLEKRFDAEGMRLVHEAYELARSAHSLQRRKSGEPYILHPLAVARIVGVDLEQDARMVAAALLHDVVEDTPYTLADITGRFGSEVAALVNVVTKRPKANYDQSKQIDNFRQLQQYIPINSQYISTLLKIIGVAYLGQFSAGICKDAGYSSMAGQIEIFCKLSIMVISMPILLALLETISSFLS